MFSTFPTFKKATRIICFHPSSFEDKLPPFKRLSHKEMQEMSVKNLPGLWFDMVENDPKERFTFFESGCRVLDLMFYKQDEILLAC